MSVDDRAFRPDPYGALPDVSVVAHTAAAPIAHAPPPPAPVPEPAFEPAPPPRADNVTVRSTIVGTGLGGATAGGTVKPDDIRRDWGRLGLGATAASGATGTGGASVLLPDPVSLQATAVSVTLRPSRLTAASADIPDTDRDFALEERLGVGGMGEVFRARQMSLNRQVAVKVMRPERAGDPNQRAKFIGEAVITGALDHPNIIPLHELGQTPSGHVFYAMKEVRGAAWSERIRAMTEAENLDVLVRVADAVAYAHDRGVIHRDLKPHNIMLGDYGEVLVMDWGLAVPYVPDADGHRPPMGRAGTPAYMAPEMARADEAAIGPASDIYLLGAILYEIVAGHAPHAGANLYACIAAAANNRIEPTDRADRLVDIARKTMATRPADRYATVKEFQAALVEERRHAQSMALEVRARESLAAGRTYEDYHRAVFGFGEALALWPDNASARQGLWDARVALAERALRQGDCDLAAAAARDIEPRPEPRAAALPVRMRSDADKAALEAARKANEARAELVARTDKAAREHRQRRQRLRRYRWIATGLVCALLLVFIVATAVTASLYRAAESARRREADANAEREIADRLALAERDEKLSAFERERREREAREAAERELREAAARLARNGLMVENSRWIFTAAEAAGRQTEAARRVNGDVRFTVRFGHAEPLLFEIIPPGEFVMGSIPPNDLGRAADPDRNVHEFLHPARITRAFWMAATPLTRAQWRALVPVETAAELSGGSPDELVAASGDRDAWLWRTRAVPPAEADWPATGLSPRDIREKLLPALASHAPPGLRFRLPTEAEWEYAARAGTATRYYTGDAYADALRAGWLVDNANGAADPFPVAGLAPNAWGLYDMIGNVYELVADFYAPNYYLDAPFDDPLNAEDTEGAARYVARGGSFVDQARDARAAARISVHEDNRYFVNGVRLALGPLPQ